MKTLGKTAVLGFFVTIGIFVIAILFSCNSEKNDKEGPVYRGEKGVVIRGNSEDDQHQLNGPADSLSSDSLKKRNN